MPDFWGAARAALQSSSAATAKPCLGWLHFFLRDAESQVTINNDLNPKWNSSPFIFEVRSVEEEVLKFLRDEMGVPRQRRSLLQQRAGGNAGAKTCWHNCETKKRSYKQDVDGPLESQLRALYAPDALLLQDSQKYVRWVR